MPQMAPMNWSILMIYFIFILYTFNLINYYSFNYLNTKMLKISKSLKKLNWKW